MADQKTLFVIGAGASREANLPTNQELKKKIASILDIRFEHLSRRISGDQLVYEALRHELQNTEPSARDINSYLHAAWSIRDAMPQAISIDNFIDTHQGDEKIELCGKLAIIRSILDAESNSLLYINPRESNSKPNFGALDKTWFNSFFRLLTESCRKNEFYKRIKSVAFIVFNYDRCIEHFLFHSLQNYYGISKDEAAELVQGMEIYHPYGTVGCLPWEKKSTSIEFGADSHPSQLLSLSKGIKTFAEGTDPKSSEIIAIRQQMLGSKIIVFLGFAFHRLNLDLLRPVDLLDPKPRKQRYFATAKGISNSDCDLIKKDLVKLAYAQSQNIQLQNELTCSQLFHEYWRSLSLIE